MDTTKLKIGDFVQGNLVTPSEPQCKRCAYCCMNAFLVLQDVSMADDKREIGKWLSYHRCDTVKYPTDKGDVLGVKIPISCIHLIFDIEKGVYICNVYDKRPNICREYNCKKIIDEMVIKLARENGISV